ncbi:MAG: hypothetical protein SGI90_14085 [Candidatus Eisenbacteria bacterium]|nr:hypothetical protein [Candidatus Eisenbacteria bacterium]
MNSRRVLLAVALMAPFGTLNDWSAIGPVSARAEDKPAPLFNDLGSRHWPISTSNPMAQRYFDQGMILTYGFNHAEAHRSFLEVTRLDPDCAMGWWGAGLVLGPNINAAMDSAAAPEAARLTGEAMKRRASANPRERALIEALDRRYCASPPEDRKPLDVAFSQAMRDVAKRFPEDIDILAMTAEAIMDLTPWDYWTPDGKPNVNTKELLGFLERVLAADPNHPGAIHYYIHAVEASDHPEKAETYADKLPGLAPGAGHLVHMPSHLYIRTGRYQEAIDLNEAAAKADDSYLSQCHAQGVYELGYVPHNHHMKFAAACLSGQSAVALAAAAGTAARTAHPMMRDPGLGTLQHYAYVGLYGLVRFGRWSEILNTPQPPADLKYPNGVWHFARGMAHTGTGKFDMAEAELANLTRFAAMDTLEKVTIWETNTTKHILEIGRDLLAGEIKARRGDWAGAIRHFEAGVAGEDKLRYNEPTDWNPAVRHYLGWALLEAKRAKEAEAVYREDLRRYPGNGWALLGLSQSLMAQGKTKAANEAAAQFQKSWVRADVKLISSRL